jgi:putative methionine-R-sulfoxide reductase with GAF domain
VADDELIEAVRAQAEADAPVEGRALRVAELVRTHTGRRWVGMYRVDGDEVVNLAWSGPAAPAYPRFPADRGLTGAAIAARSPVVSNDVASDPRYLAALASTGSRRRSRCSENLPPGRRAAMARSAGSPGAG